LASPKRKSSKTRIETKRNCPVLAREPVRKGNPAKQGLKQKVLDSAGVPERSEKEIQQNKD